MVKLNKVKQRMVYLAPAVQAGWDDESNIHDFEMLKILGKGSFGVVKKVRHRKTHKIYAVKELDKKEIRVRNMNQQVREEVRVMYSLNHPNIIKLYSHFEDDVSIYLIMEYAEKGQLYQSMLNSPQKRFSEEEVAKIVYQTVEAVKCMHEKGIAHRDIKPENILIDDKGNAKLADFGWSRFILPQAKRTTYCGTLDYLAPEMLDKDHKHDTKVDLWAIGVLIFELTTGMSPFSANLVLQGKTQAQAESEVKSNIRNINFVFPKQLSATCKDLLQKLLIKNPAERLSAYGISQHSWMKTHFMIPEFKKPNWSDELRKQFKDILETDTSSQKAFSKEEMYEYNRLQSIISTKVVPNPGNVSFTESQHSAVNISQVSGKSQNSQKHHSASGSGEKTPELSADMKDLNQSMHSKHFLLQRVKELQTKLADKDKQIQVLKKGGHTECDKKRSQIQQSYAILRKKFDAQFIRLAASEAKVRQLELELAKKVPDSTNTVSSSALKPKPKS